MTVTATTIRKTVFFDAAPETVWAFLTEKEKLAQWYHRSDDDLREGERYELYRIDDSGTRIRQIWGRVLAMDAPRKLVCTFVVEPLGGTETTVTFTLEQAVGGTRLSLVHEGVEQAAGEQALHLLRSFDHGWDEHLDRMRTSVAEPAAA